MRHSLRLIGGAVIALVFLVVCFSLTKSAPESWNDIARIATIESLVERGTWAIDDSPWVDQTKDKVFLNEQFYSDKMPLLSWLGAGVYMVLHRGFGLSLAPGCASCAYRLLTWLLIGIPGAILLWLFFDFAFRRVPLWAAVIGTFALGGGTMVFPYALVFNHHLPAAVAIFASFYIIVQARDRRGWLLVAGMLAAMAVCFDALAGIVAASVCGIALVRTRREFVFFALGAFIPVIITAWLDYQIAGTVIPPYLITNGYDFPGSEFPATVGGNGTPDDYPAYAFRMFLGGQGLFAYNPLLILALAGALAVTFQRDHKLRLEGMFAALGFATLCIYLAVWTGNYGGTAYGERWFVPAIPLLFAFIFFVPPLSQATWKNAGWILFIPLLALSVISTAQGALGPWQYTPPPLQMTRRTEFPILGLKWNMRFP